MDNIWGRIQIIRIIPLIIWWNNQVFTNKISWIVSKPLTILVLIYLFMHIIYIIYIFPRYSELFTCPRLPRLTLPQPVKTPSIRLCQQVLLRLHEQIFILFSSWFSACLKLQYVSIIDQNIGTILMKSTHDISYPQSLGPKVMNGPKRPSTFHQGFVWRVLSILDMIGGAILGSSPQSNLTTWR
jgi:hypothetical protein